MLSVSGCLLKLTLNMCLFVHLFGHKSKMATVWIWSAALKHESFGLVCTSLKRSSVFCRLVFLSICVVCIHMDQYIHVKENIGKPLLLFLPLVSFRWSHTIPCSPSHLPRAETQWVQRLAPSFPLRCCCCCCCCCCWNGHFGRRNTSDWITFSNLMTVESAGALIWLHMSNSSGLIEFILLSVAGHAWLCCVCGQRPSESERYVLNGFTDGFRTTYCISNKAVVPKLLVEKHSYIYKEVQHSAAPPVSDLH